MSRQEFPLGVIEPLGFYVYFLLDPQTNQVFYVGKGTGNRVFAHLNAAITGETPSDKLDKIRELRAQGLKVRHVILRHGLTEKEAFEVEAALIDFLGLQTLTNQLLGYKSDDRGIMGVEDIVAKYAAPEVEILEPSILITVNKLYRKGMSADELYEITRGNWVIGARRAKVKYAFTVFNGIIREVYEIHDWHSVTARTAEQKTQSRWRFSGVVAAQMRHYVGGSTARYVTLGAQNPIRYVNC